MSLSFAYNWMTYFHVGITYFFPCCTVFLYVVHNSSLRNTYFEHRTLISSETYFHVGNTYFHVGITYFSIYHYYLQWGMGNLRLLEDKMISFQDKMSFSLGSWIMKPLMKLKVSERNPDHTNMLLICNTAYSFLLHTWRRILLFN